MIKKMKQSKLVSCLACEKLKEVKSMIEFGFVGCEGIINDHCCCSPNYCCCNELLYSSRPDNTELNDKISGDVINEKDLIDFWTKEINGKRFSMCLTCHKYSNRKDSSWGTTGREILN